MFLSTKKVTGRNHRNSGVNNLLANIVPAYGRIAFVKEQRETFCHIDAQEPIEVTDYRVQYCERRRLRYSMIPEVLLAKGGNLQMELDH